MITLILIVLTGIINALMDIIIGRYDQSIFSKFNPEWWDPRISWSPTQRWKVKINGVDYYIALQPV